MLNLSELFEKATTGWTSDEVEMLKADIKAQPENRAAWVETLNGLIEFESGKA